MACSRSEFQAQLKATAHAKFVGMARAVQHWKAALHAAELRRAEAKGKQFIQFLIETSEALTVTEAALISATPIFCKSFMEPWSLLL